LNDDLLETCSQLQEGATLKYLNIHMRKKKPI
jgi:hypothetical protein